MALDIAIKHKGDKLTSEEFNAVVDAVNGKQDTLTCYTENDTKSGKEVRIVGNVGVSIGSNAHPNALAIDAAGAVTIEGQSIITGVETGKEVTDVPDNIFN